MKRARISSDGLTICFCFNGFTEKLPSTCCREKDTEVNSTTQALLSRLKAFLGHSTFIAGKGGAV